MTTKTFIPGNWTDYIPIVVFIFTCGIFYNVQSTQANELIEVKEELSEVKDYFTGKLDKKIKIQNEHDNRIKELELYRAWEEGYNKAKEKYDK